MPVVEINTSCNPVWVTIPDGAVETLAASYAAGTVAADQTLLIQAGDGGPVIFQANAAATGSLVRAETNAAGAILFNITDDSTQVVRSAMADGATAVGLIVDTTTAWSNAAARILSIRTNAVVVASFDTAGTLFSPQVQNSTSVTLMSSAADGAAAVAGIVDTTTAWANATSKILSLRTNAVEQFNFRPSGHIYGDSANPYVQLDDSAGAKLFYSTTGVRVSAGLYEFDVSGSTKIEITTVTVRPGANLSMSLGDSGRRYQESWAAQRATVEKVVTFSATPTFTPSDGDYQQITMTGNITSWAVVDGLAGEVMTLEFIQDATGTRTLSAPPANVLLTAGVLVLTVTANKRDTVTLRYNTANDTWNEIGRALNL